ncbi:MAG: TOBE-like domain-containing protein [Bryobacteraceae bacterium]|nr:TOBE-like domain-containing protein [Bryobacteraceae bacterium]
MNIRLEHISRSFGGFTALDDVSLEIREGELVALLGPSGSGKTTLLRIIAGLDAPDAREGARIRFDGAEMDLRAGARQVGFVFQHYALFRTMTVFENIAFGLRVKPKRERADETQIRARVTELLSLIQLESIAGRYPSQLSGGQRQRVALARALAIEPRILLLDEPFGALDAKVRQDLRRWLRRLHDKMPVTSVLVTHDQEEALEVADRIVVMRAGKVEQEGTPEEVFHHPKTAFVMDFLGNVNLFHARMEGGHTGAMTQVRARPHDLEVSREEGSGSAVRGKVTRVQTAGAAAKIEVATEGGETIMVEMAHDRFKAMGIAAGETVFVRVKDARVFVEDYTI